MTRHGDGPPALPAARRLDDLELLDSYLLAAEQGRWRILGDVVHD